MVANEQIVQACQRNDLWVGGIINLYEFKNFSWDVSWWAVFSMRYSKCTVSRTILESHKGSKGWGRCSLGIAVFSHHAQFLHWDHALVVKVWLDCPRHLWVSVQWWASRSCGTCPKVFAFSQSQQNCRQVFWEADQAAWSKIWYRVDSLHTLGSSAVKRGEYLHHRTV